MSDVQEFDAIIVGAGFAGVHQLIQFRKLGLKVRLLEAGGGLGGTWYWNTYPGARVDSENPIYQFSDPELYKDWNYTEKFPGWREIQQYFEYVDKKLDLSRDISYNSRVVSAVWDDATDRWTLTTEAGTVYRTQWLSLCTGIGSKYYIPPFKGLDTFKGEVHHTSRWPTDYDLKGKRIGVIGTGSTGVQLIQEVAPIAEHLTVFQRTPNLSLPMRQTKLDLEEEAKLKEYLYPIQFGRRNQTFSGYLHDLDMKPTLETTLEERTLYYEDKWQKGGFHFWIGSYGDIFFKQDANDVAYAFWRDKTRARINDPEMKEKLAPMKSPHPFGVKRPSLEQNYFEVYNQPNVDLIDVNKTPIAEITPDGIITSDGIEHKLDALIFATGFDMVTGGITSIDIRGQDDVPIKEKWVNGVRSYLGLGSAKFPNMFWIYGPQSPAAFSNGPSTIEFTSEWIADCIKHCRENKISHIVASDEAQNAWSEQLQQIASMGLWLGAKHSWYMGSNVEGRKVEILQFPGGVPMYEKAINDSASKGYEGWIVKQTAA
ncbi:cyclohexanone monooxygenase [Lentinula boryana]|uniref:Cyclohexanone monooxygenase n=1 Tax=Lentinula boryana TaxID=40481 RepID=A0ABQ8QFZ4_9AGAR|nr:cyclohexanone monooxygenase [Lentinula boryana]